jgi:glycosyltransferase involved in cell wall biosynthesis
MYLEAAKTIIQMYPEIKFHLLGEGTLVPEIENFIRENNLGSSVNFEFSKSPTEIFARSSIFISIQKNNNYPSQSVLEAMACGNAIIASDVGDTRLFVNEETGILIPLNLKYLIEAIEQLISDPIKMRKLGANARKFVLENHTIEKSAEYFHSLFQKAHLRALGS